MRNNSQITAQKGPDIRHYSDLFGSRFFARCGPAKSLDATHAFICMTACGDNRLLSISGFPLKRFYIPCIEFCAGQSIVRWIESLSKNYEWACGEGIWLEPKQRVCFRTGNSVPTAGSEERTNAGHRQKARRPKGFRAQGRMALLLLSRRSTRDILFRRASPSGLGHKNRPTPNF